MPRRLAVAPGPRRREELRLPFWPACGLDAWRTKCLINSHLALELVELQDLDQVGVSPFHGDGLGRLAVVVERAGVAA